MSERLAYSITEAAKALGISRWLMQEEIRQGRVQAVKIGRRTVVPRWALEERLHPSPSVDALLASVEDLRGPGA